MSLPDPLSEITLNMVSYHAVTRYCQRVLKVIVPGMEDDTGRTFAVALAHTALAGLTVNAVRERILSKAVRIALQHGGSPSVIGNGYVVRFGDSPRVVTTIEPYQGKGHTNIFTDAEARRNEQRYSRRQQRRRVSMGVAS
jgi:hypothetical protein